MMGYHRCVMNVDILNYFNDTPNWVHGGIISEVMVYIDIHIQYGYLCIPLPH